MITTSLEMEEQMKADIETLAKAEDRSFGGMMRILLDIGIEHFTPRKILEKKERLANKQKIVQ